MLRSRPSLSSHLDITMDNAEFDRLADTYDQQHRASIAISGEDPEFFARYKIAALAEYAMGLPAEGTRILDFGAGVGNSVPFFRQHFPRASLTCADPSSRSLSISRQRFPGPERYTILSGNEIPLEESAFDIAFSACVFHHIPPDEHIHWLGELQRVTRSGGMLTIFEHNPFNPLTVYSVKNSPIDENAILISARQLLKALENTGWKRAAVRYHVFFPRALAMLRPLERHLKALPIGAQYSVSAFKP